MGRKKKINIFEIYFYISLVLMIFTLMFVYYVVHFSSSPSISLPYKEKNTLFIVPSGEIVGYSFIKIPAVMHDNSTPAFVRASLIVTEGKGDIFINIKGTLLAEDTQNSIRKAIKYALIHENKSLDLYNFYLTLESNAAVLTGPSAGASFGVLAIAALRNKTPDPEVMITGTLSKTGEIGLSGKIYEKALASKASGAKLFLIPVGSSVIQSLEVTEECDEYEGKKYCEVFEHIKNINISKEVGIQVKEVGTLDEALLYFGI